MTWIATLFLLLNFATLTNPEIKSRFDDNKTKSADAPVVVTEWTGRRPGCRQSPTDPC